MKMTDSLFGSWKIGFAIHLLEWPKSRPLMTPNADDMELSWSEFSAGTKTTLGASKGMGFNLKIRCLQKSLEESAGLSFKGRLQESVAVLSTICQVLPALHLLGSLPNFLWLGGTYGQFYQWFLKVKCTASKSEYLVASMVSFHLCHGASKHWAEAVPTVQTLEWVDTTLSPSATHSRHAAKTDINLFCYKPLKILRLFVTSAEPYLYWLQQVMNSRL